MAGFWFDQPRYLPMIQASPKIQMVREMIGITP
jgi:hypothetical protein